MNAPRSHGPGPDTDRSHPTADPAGLAHVATLAFVGARTIPGFGFPVSLAGGTAVARATHRRGARSGLAAGIAATLESIAILGPARLSGPVGQLATAPVIGGLARAGRGRVAQIAATTLIRGAFNALWTLLTIFVIVGGLDTFTGAYDATIGRLPLTPTGTAAAVAATGAWLVVWAIGASWFQVHTFARAGRRWDELEAGKTAPHPPPAADDTVEVELKDLPPSEPRRRLDPRAATAATVIAFALLLISTAPPLLAAVTAWLALAWAIVPAEREVLRPGAILAATLAVGAFVANWIGGDGIGAGLEHGVRGALLVMAATWMRGAAGPDGFREVVRRILARVLRIRFSGELRSMMDALEGDRRLGAALSSLTSELRAAGEASLSETLDLIIDWVAAEAERFAPEAAPPHPALRLKIADLAVFVAAALPALALTPG